MNNYKKNLKLLTENHVYSKEMEHDACGVGVIASTEGKKSREIVEYGIEALKAVWHRGAVDADGKTGDGAGIHVYQHHHLFFHQHQLLLYAIQLLKPQFHIQQFLLIFFLQLKQLHQLHKHHAPSLLNKHDFQLRVLNFFYNYSLCHFCFF